MSARRGKLWRRATLLLLLVLVIMFGAAQFGSVDWEESEWLPNPAAPVIQAARDLFAERRALEHKQALLFAADEAGVDPHLLAGLMISESSGRVGAVSHKGALGLFQLMPVTAAWRAEKMGLEKPTKEQLLSNGQLNARLGADNLAWLLGLYDGDRERALVAYNAGPGRLKSFEKKAGGWQAWRDERRAAGNSEIFTYVDRVLGYADSFKAHGLFESGEPTGM